MTRTRSDRSSSCGATKKVPSTSALTYHRRSSRTSTIYSPTRLLGMLPKVLSYPKGFHLCPYAPCKRRHRSSSRHLDGRRRLKTKANSLLLYNFILILLIFAYLSLFYSLALSLSLHLLFSLSLSLCSPQEQGWRMAQEIHRSKPHPVAAKHGSESATYVYRMHDHAWVERCQAPADVVVDALSPQSRRALFVLCQVLPYDVPPPSSRVKVLGS